MNDKNENTNLEDNELDSKKWVGTWASAQQS